MLHAHFRRPSDIARGRCRLGETVLLALFLLLFVSSLISYRLNSKPLLL